MAVICFDSIERSIAANTHIHICEPRRPLTEAFQLSNLDTRPGWDTELYECKTTAIGMIIQ